MELAKLLSMTAVLTLLIWISADSLVNETVSVHVVLEVAPGENSDMRIEVAPAAKAQLYEAQVFGPRKIVEDVRAREPLHVRLPVADRPTGETTIMLDRDALQREMAEQWNEFRKLRIVAIEPNTLPVLIDRMVEHELDVTLRRLGLSYEVEPRAKQTIILARMRESVYNRLTAAGERLQIDIAGDVERLLRGKPTGQTVAVSVPLDARPFGPEAELRPDRIEVTAVVKSNRQTAEIPTVPIKPAVSFANLAKPYLAVAADGTPLTLVTQTIRVTGPAEEVARLLRGETRAYGVIQLKEADLDELGVLRAWTPELHLPPAIELAEEPDPIEFKLIDGTVAELQR